ncbi:unnamed protein product [Lupinus luteus]|uniref:Uncharacterized protein n=1 Tax=Lupinus luteus TaxID=3873 RepID=A0AAV1XJ33_LUPLU
MARKLTLPLFFLVSMFLLPRESYSEHDVYSTEAPTTLEPSTADVDPPCICIDVAPPPPPTTTEAPPPPPVINQPPPPPPSTPMNGTTEGSLQPQGIILRCCFTR